MKPGIKKSSIGLLFPQFPVCHICLFLKPDRNFKKRVNYILQEDTLSRRSLVSIMQVAEVHQMAAVADGSFFEI